MAFVRKNKKLIVAAVTFVLAGAGAVGYGVPEPFHSLIVSWVSGL